MRRRRPPGFSSVYKAAAGGQDPDGEDRRPPQSFASLLASRRPSAIDAPLQPSTDPRPAPQSAALATVVAGQQAGASPTNGSTVAPSIPPPPASAVVTQPPRRAYPFPAPGGPTPVSGLWGGGGNAIAPPPGATAGPQPASPALAAAAPQSAFQQATDQVSDAALNAGGTVDTSGWTPEDFQAAASATGNYYNPMVVGPPGSAQANAWAATQVSQARHPQDPAAVARKNAESNALRAAQTASMGALTGTPQFSSGVADPAAAFQQFEASGYTGAQALADGWLTGVGKPGWQGGGSAPPAQSSGATPPAPAASSPVQPTPDPYAPPGYTPGVAAQTPTPPPAGTVVDTQRPQASAPPARPAPMPRFSSYFGGLSKAAGG